MSSDAAVIERSLTEPEEFAMVFDRHFQRVYAFLRRRYGAEVAADLSSETFLRAFRQRSAYRPDTPTALPWLLGIATRVGGDQRRREARQLRAQAALRAQPARTDGGDPMASAPSRAALVEALLRLKTGDRDALLLLAWGDLTYAEIASALEVPLGTVRSRINRARRQLREALALPIETTLLTDGGEHDVG